MILTAIDAGRHTNYATVQASVAPPGQRAFEITVSSDP